jgi:1-acyl-sn-glycerol-3-phosphate acyltransferase
MKVDEAQPTAMAWRSLRFMCRRHLAKHVDVTIEDLERVPETGPVVIVARHYHHLYDGCVIGTSLDRHLHILVAADWTSRGSSRGLLERASRVARWPVILRLDAPTYQPERFPDAATRATYDAEAVRYLRRAASDAVRLLRDGHVLLVFPEGYPTIDPSFTPKTGDEILPFQPGFARLVTLAQRDGVTRVSLVPAGLEYIRLPEDRWRLILRYGEPVFHDQARDHQGIVSRIEERVRRLSGTIGPSTSC